MRLSTLFLACFAIASVPALGWSAWTAWSAWDAWTNATAAVQAAAAMGDALLVMEALSTERDALQEAALSAGPTDQDLPEIAARNDALLDHTQHTLRQAGLPDLAVIEARGILRNARARSAELMRRPLASRDPYVLPTVMTQLEGRLQAVDAAVAQAQSKAARASAAVGALVEVAALAVDIQAIAARRASHLTAWFGQQQLYPSQLDELPRLTGQLHFAWAQLKRQVMVVGDPPSLTAAIELTSTAFFHKAEPIYQAYVTAATAGSPPPLRLADWRRWTLATLPATLPARDAAITEAVGRGKTLAAHARSRLALVGTATIAALVLAAGALSVLLRRLILPMQGLAESVLRLAGGDTHTTVPGLTRRDEVGAVAAAVEVFRQNALALQQTNARFAASLRNMSQGLCMFGADGRLIVANRQLADLFGQRAAETACAEISSLQALAEKAEEDGAIAAADAAWLLERFTSLAGSPEPAAFIWELADGRAYSTHYRPVSNGGWLATFEDVTERRQAEARIAYMAHHDALTGLANRVLFRARLVEALGRIRRGGSFAVLCLDLDYFKTVNDTLGHPIGDALLCAVTERLRSAVRESDTVARLGGDEFAVLQASGEQPRDASALAQRLVTLLGEPYQIEGHQVVIGSSVGIALAQGECDQPDVLLKNADLALYQAKAGGRGAWRYFEPEMDAHMQARRLLELDLRRAVETGAFELHYQPWVDSRSRRPVGFEALLRWCHRIHPVETALPWQPEHPTLTARKRAS